MIYVVRAESVTNVEYFIRQFSVSVLFTNKQIYRPNICEHSFDFTASHMAYVYFTAVGI